MSKCTPKSEEFINDIKRAAEKYNREAWSYEHRISKIKVYYDASTYNKRDYVLEAEVTNAWGSSDTERLKEFMRDAGATNFLNKVRGQYAFRVLDMAFDIKQSKMKQLGISSNNK